MKRTLLAASAAAVAGLATADTYYTGDGTAYTLGSVSSGNCNFMYDPGVGSNYAALNAAQWDDTLNCGRCAEVSCADDACSDTTSTVTVFLVDQCPECAEGDLDLSPTVFKTLTGSDPARYTIKWRFVDCPVSGSLQYCAKSGSSSYWLAVQPANMLTGVASMTIGGKTPTMVDSAYYFLLDSGGVALSSVEIATTSVSGETVTETVALTADSCTEGSKQFSGGSSSSSSTTATSSSSTSSNATPKLTTPTPTTAAPATTAPATTAPAATTAAPSTQSSASSAGTSETGVSESQVASDFDTLNDGGSNETSVVGTVSAPAEEGSSSGVSILDSSETGVANTPTATSATSDASDTQEANTKSEDTSAGTSPVLIALAVAAAVGAVALAAVYVRVQKKKIDDKVNDRDDNAMQRSFDTFNSPVRVTSAIAQI